MPIEQFRYAYRNKFLNLKLPFFISVCLALFGVFTFLAFTDIDERYLCECDSEFWVDEATEVLQSQYPFLFSILVEQFPEIGILYIREIGGSAYIDIHYDFFLIYFVIICFLAWFFIWADSSMLLSKIQDIENPIGEDGYLRIRNKEGKLGLCEFLPGRIVQRLPFSYTEISPLGQETFICKTDGKCGLYHTGAKKMILPVEYDQIEYLNEETVSVTHNGHQERFSIKGPIKINVR